MNKKNWFVIFIIGVTAVVLIFVLWRWSERWLSPPAEPFHVVPQDAVMIIEVNDFSGFIHHLTTENMLWKDLGKVVGIPEADNMLQHLDSVINAENVLRQLFRKNPVLISLHESGKDKLAMLGIVKIPGFIKESAVKNALSGSSSIRTDMEKIRKYNGHRIFIIKGDQHHTEINYLFTQGLLVMSSSRIVLESSLRQLSASSSILDQDGFVPVMETAGANTTGNLYIRPEKMPDWIKTWLRGDIISSIKRVFPIAGWSELDITLQKESLLLNGFSYPGEDYVHLLDVFRDGSPGNIDLYSLFPSTAYAGAVLYVKDWARYRKRLLSLREKQQNIRLERMTDDYKRQCRCQPEEVLIKILGSQAGVAYMKISNQAPVKNRVVVVQVKSQSMARNAMEEMMKAYSAENGIPFRSMYRNIIIDRETKLRLYKFPFPGFFASFFGNLFGEGPYPFFTFYENYLIAAGSEAAITRFVQDNMRNYTLENDPDFKEFTDGLSSRSNFFFYVHLPSAEEFASMYFGKTFMKRFHSYAGSSMKINYLGYQAISQNHLVYNNLYLRYSKEGKKDATTVWESLLDTAMHYKPQLFINHYTKENEIFIQDEKNQVYLINNAGRILWKIKIPEKIKGQAYQIDYFKNGKLQILFNTRHYLYLLDRNGNNVEHFPVLLRSPATNGAAVFDYEKNRTYRIFIGGEDKKMYLYNKQGGLVQGWQLKRYESTITTPVKHFRIRGKDYIVFSDAMNVYILDRRGNSRVKAGEQIPRVLHQNIVLDDFSAASPSLLVNGLEGIIYRISFSGKVSKIPFPGIRDDSFFTFADMDGDRRGEYIFLYNNILEVYLQPDKKKYSRTFPAKITDPPVIFTFSSRDKKLGVVDATNHMIYLVNNNGTFYKGFPLTGRSLFTIGKFDPAGKRFNLIVGGEDNFLYNYIVK